ESHSAAASLAGSILGENDGWGCRPGTCHRRAQSGTAQAASVEPETEVGQRSICFSRKAACAPYLARQAGPGHVMQFRPVVIEGIAEELFPEALQPGQGLDVSAACRGGKRGRSDRRH